MFVYTGVQVHVVRQVLLEPLICGAEVGETIRGRDLHLVNLLEGHGAARHQVDVMDKRVSRGMHPAGHLSQRPEAGRSGEAPATTRLTRFQTFEKPVLLAKELGNEEDRDSATRAVPDDHDLSPRLHVQIMQLWAVCSNPVDAVWTVHT